MTIAAIINVNTKVAICLYVKKKGVECYNS